MDGERERGGLMQREREAQSVHTQSNSRPAEGRRDAARMELANCTCFQRAFAALRCCIKRLTR